jgi:hypothetical protein
MLRDPARAPADIQQQVARLRIQMLDQQIMAHGAKYLVIKWANEIEMAVPVADFHKVDTS